MVEGSRWSTCAWLNGLVARMLMLPPPTVPRRIQYRQGMLVGIVSQRDLFLSGLVRALGFGTSATEKVLDSLLVKEAMTTDVLTTTPETPLHEAAALMRDQKVGCLPVVEGDVLVGILTEGDFVAAAASS